MATQPLQQIALMQRPGGGAFRRPTKSDVEGAGQTFKRGDLVKLSSGKVILATAGDPLYGQAKADASGTTDAEIGVHEISPDELFLANVYHSLAASALSAQAQKGVRYKLIRNSGLWHVDIENTTVEDATTATAQVVVVDFPTSDVLSKSAAGGNFTKVALGDIYGLVIVRFVERSIATDGNPNYAMLQGFG